MSSVSGLCSGFAGTHVAVFGVRTAGAPSVLNHLSGWQIKSNVSVRPKWITIMWYMCHFWRQFGVSPLSGKCHFCWQGVPTACCWRLMTTRMCSHQPAISCLSLQKTHTVKVPVGGRGDRINRRVRSEGTVSNEVSFVSKWVIYCPRFIKSLELQILYFILRFQWLHKITHFRKHDIRQFFTEVNDNPDSPAGLKLITGTAW